MNAVPPVDARDAGGYATRLKLALQEPRIQTRLPGLECTPSVVETVQRYDSSLGGFSGTLKGEVVRMSLKVGETTIAEKSWSTKFPLIFNPQKWMPGELLGADVQIEELLIQVLGLKVFTPEDLEALTNSNMAEVRASAAANMTDERVLGRLALDRDGRVRRAALRNLRDAGVIAKVAMKDEDPGVRELAVERVSDQAVLSKVAVADQNPAVRRAAIRRLSDDAALEQIATEDQDAISRISAVKRLADQVLLAKIAFTDENLLVRLSAIRNLKDDAVLATIARADREPSARCAAADRLSDQTVLANVAKGDKDPIVRLYAVWRLTDESALTRVAAQDTDDRVRKAATNRLNRGR